MVNLKLSSLAGFEMNQNNVKRLVKVLTALAIFSYFLKLPMFPWLVSNLGYTYFSAITLGYTYITWEYYKALPMSRKTVLTYLVQDIVMIQFVYKTFEVVKQWLISSGMLNGAFATYPNFTCSLFSPSPNYTLTISLVLAIFSFQAFARLYSTIFLSLNHEKARLIVLSVSIAIWIIELTVVGLINGTFCGRIEIYNIHFLTNLELDLDSAKTINMFILIKIILAIISKIVYWNAGKKKLRTRPPMHIKSVRKECRVSTIEIEMAVFNEGQFTTEASSQNMPTSRSQLGLKDILEDLSRYKPRSNAVAQEGTVIPQGKTQVHNIFSSLLD